MCDQLGEESTSFPWSTADIIEEIEDRSHQTGITFAHIPREAHGEMELAKREFPDLP